MINRIKSDKALSASILLNIVFSFMLCVFGPLNVYFGNITEFWFGLTDLAPFMIIAFVVFFLVLSIVTALFYKVNLIRGYYLVLLGMTILLYIQGNFIPRNYGVFDGKKIKWDQYEGYALASIILFFCVLLFVVAMVIWARTKIYTIGIYLCSFLLMVWFITIGTLIIQNWRVFGNSSNGVTSEKSLELSKEKNIVIFLLDAFDAEYMDNILKGENADKYSNLFKDFTYYPDTLGGYPTTKGAIPHILTGKRYKNEIPFWDYVSNAYQETSLYEVLQKNNYSVGVYTKDFFMDIDDIKYDNAFAGKNKIKNSGRFFKDFGSLVLFNYFPHQLKRYFTVEDDAFEENKALNGKHELWAINTMWFYKKLKSEAITVSEDNPAFRFYHLRGAHPYLKQGEPKYLFGEDLIEGTDYDVYDQIYGNFTLLEEYFKQLKDNGIYDNTSIIIMADHGQVEKSQNPLLMIKNIGEVGEKLTVSDVPMSYDYMNKGIEDLANSSLLDESYIRNCTASDGMRQFMYYVWDDTMSSDYLPEMTELYLEKDEKAQDGNNLNPSGVRYRAGGVDSSFSEYVLGTEINLGSEEEIEKYAFLGVPTPEGWGSWTDGQVVLFGISVSDLEKTDTLFKLHCIPYNPPQRVEISANGYSIYQGIISAHTTIQAVIPKEVLKKENIIKLYIPDAVSPYSLGESLNRRELGLALYSMELDGLDGDISKRFFHLYELGDELILGDDEIVSAYCLYGIPLAEGWGSWTDGNKVLFEFKIDDWDGNDVVMNLHCIPYNPPQNVEILANGNQVYINDISEDTNIETIIPSSFIEDGVVRLQMNLPNAVSPKSRGESADERELALALYEFKMASLSDVDEAVKNTHYYSLGTSLAFGEENSEGNKYCTSGLSNPEKSGTWSDDEVVSFDFDIDAVGKDLNLTMGYGTYGKQRILVYANEKLLEEYEFDGWEEHSFVIPEEIYDKTITIRIELPNASSPKENGESEDDRILGINISSIKIE